MTKQIIFIISAFLFLDMTFTNAATAAPPSRYYYELRIYHLQDKQQEQKLDDYLQHAFIPALHRHHIAAVGVFKPIEQKDSTIDVYVLIPYASWKQKTELPERLAKDAVYQNDGKNYLETPYNDPVFTRMESIILRAFPDMPAPARPMLKTPMNQRVYELRSYESPTEALNENKVNMFNAGGEIEIFKRLNFNAVFYGNVISGSHMPNLMYLTTYNNMDDREAHWKAFGSDPVWKRLSAMPKYQHNVSHIDDLFLHPAPYSDY